jgi:hypothetical protein
MNYRFIIATASVGALLNFYWAWRFWNFRLAQSPPARTATLTVEQRRKRLRVAALTLVFSGLLMLGLAVWLWLRSEG